MGNAFITKGSTVTIGSGSTDIKAILIEDVDIGVGDETPEKIVASDGTTYLFNKAQEDNTFEPSILLTDDTFDAVFTAVYGAGSTVAGGTTWSLRNAGGTINSVVVTSPIVTGGTTKLTYTAVNARGASIIPTFKINKGFEAKLKFACDYWTVKRTT